MIARYVYTACLVALFLTGIYCSPLPELGHEVKAAARAGDPAAQMELARMYYVGDVVARNAQEGIHWLKAAAEQKYPQALFALGQFYLSGQDMEPDPAKGIALITEAAELDYTPAQTYLAFAYGRGLGVEQDVPQFLKWVKRAAKNGEAVSQFNLAILKLSGQFVEKDLPGAKALLIKSADQGYLEAQATIGEFLARGADGNKPDLVEACKWFAIAGSQGHQRANSFLVSLVKSMTKDQMNEAADRANQWLTDHPDAMK